MRRRPRIILIHADHHRGRKTKEAGGPGDAAQFAEDRSNLVVRADMANGGESFP